MRIGFYLIMNEGKQIGPYTLIRKLGRGGFGEVWLAERRTKFVTTKVAVKLPLDEQIDHETIKQEATLWEQASGHPNILPIIDADEYDGQVVIVSEFAPDGSLDEWLKTHGKMPVEQAVETTIKILDGLEFLHSRKIIHRDLKPANILLQGNTPRLADFGISRALRTTASSQSTNVSGTFAYMSPEGFDGKRSVQTDVWSVGVNLYQLLTGGLPYPQKEPSALIAAIMMREFEALPISIPQDVKDVVANALAKSPADRYKTATEMREDLQKILHNVSYSPIALRKILTRSKVPKNIAALPTTEYETEKARHTPENETVARDKTMPLSHVELVSRAKDSVVTQLKNSESVVTKSTALKGRDETELLPTNLRPIADRGTTKTRKSILLQTIGGGTFVVLVFVILIAFYMNRAIDTTANANLKVVNKTAGASGETNTSGTAPAKDALLVMDKQANEAYLKGDGKFFEGFLSDKFVMYEMGQRMDKAAVTKMIAGNKCDVKEGWKLEDPQMAKIDVNTYVISYKGTFDGSCTGPDGKSMKMPSPIRAATVYARNGDKWQSVFHGENAIVDPKAPPLTKKEASKKKGDKAAAKPADANTDALLKAEIAGWEAWKAKDAKKFDEITSTNLALVDPMGGWTSGKANVIKLWTETMKCEGITKVSVTDGFASALSPTVEILTNKGTADGTCDGQKNGSLWGTAFYVKEGDAWKLAFLFESPAM